LITNDLWRYLSPIFVRFTQIFPTYKTLLMSKASDEIREAFDLTSLDPDGLFPDVPNFQSSMTSLARLTRKLAFRVLKSLALGLGLQGVG